ncbi:SigB/SigF/SigG family RNA polymerase sigma factor [Nocardioides sp.]|uniref:SigB/SigF/SigG family RNA polymerase sigma factor n=1 Tax=Nocardioides sp. TaxID=35761 RepID=UPI00261DDFAA|nr:SigB/SigF/SigG family RNA polymerase sigma factor [Nocardioides sp.]
MSFPDPSRPTETRALSAALFVALHGADPSAAAAAREDLVALHTPLAEHLARRFQHRGEPYEDLVQVGLIALIKAIDRFEPERGLEFSTYATPTVVGELKRHLRDKGWAIRVPRRLQELRLRITQESGELTQQLGRSPTASELAASIGCTVEEIVEGLESGNAWATVSLDAVAEEDGPDVLAHLGSDDEGLALIDVRESLRPLLADLPDRERRILLLRFFRNLTQSQIANEIGVSQMHVSRLLNRTLEQLRASLDDPETAS